MARSNEKTLYIASQTGGWDTDPSANGSGYLPIVAEEISEIPAGIEQLEVAYQDNRAFPKANEVGAPSLAEITCKIPLFGLGTGAGDGSAPPAVDVLDYLLSHILQTTGTLSGEGVGSGSSSTNLVLDADAYSVGDLLAYSPGAGAASQWVEVTADAADGSYTVSPAMSPVAVTAGVIYGSRTWTPPATGLVGGDLLSLVIEDSSVGTYRAANCRISSFTLEGQVGQRIMADVTFQCDSIVEDSAAKTALPAALQSPPVTPVKALGSPIAFGGTYYGAAQFSLDLGLTTAPVNATSSLTGRAGHEVIGMAPQLTFTPLRTDAIRNFQRAASTGSALLQLGAGALSGSVLNTLAVYMGNAQVTAVESQDDEGHARQQITLMAKDPGAAGVFFRVARA